VIPQTTKNSPSKQPFIKRMKHTKKQITLKIKDQLVGEFGRHNVKLIEKEIKKVAGIATV
jgi:hypothetical protein